MLASSTTTRHPNQHTAAAIPLESGTSGSTSGNRSSHDSSRSETPLTDNGGVLPFPSPRQSGSFGGDRKALFSRHARRESNASSNNNTPRATNISHGHSRSRTRSFSESGQEAIKQLAVPISIPLVLICLSWYSTSALSNTLSKSILTSFPYPVTLTMVQFLLAVIFGVTTILAAQAFPSINSFLPKGLVSVHVGLRHPTREILLSIAPMGVFQLTGHIFSHMSTSLLPVSLVHTIKALSPLFTVTAYRMIFKVEYSPKTYLTLIPLTVGVIMTCSTEFSANFLGIFYALVATIVFVSQNMFSKKLLTPEEQPKLDKLNVLCYCSSMAFIFTSPVWLFSEGFSLFGDFLFSRGQYFGLVADSTKLSTNRLVLFLFFNGITHFLQNILAFQVLGMVTPVTYSVASLIKRIVVISVAIVWFGQHVSGVQKWGILLTFLGLYLYDRLGGDRQKKYQDNHTPKPILPR